MELTFNQKSSQTLSCLLITYDPSCISLMELCDLHLQKIPSQLASSVYPIGFCNSDVGLIIVHCIFSNTEVIK